jgi:hypothetical protein
MRTISNTDDFVHSEQFPVHHSVCEDFHVEIVDFVNVLHYCDMEFLINENFSKVKAYAAGHSGRAV